MNLVNKGRVGRDIRRCAFGADAFGVVIVVGVVFSGIVAQVRRDIQLNIAVVMDLMASFCETRDGVSQIERYMRSAIY